MMGTYCGHSLRQCLEIVNGRCCVVCTGKHATDPYRVCFECGYVFDTAYSLVQHNLTLAREMDMAYDIRYAIPELISSCPECTHDW